MEEVVGPRRCECDDMSSTISRYEITAMRPSWFELYGYPEM